MPEDHLEVLLEIQKSQGRLEAMFAAHLSNPCGNCDLAETVRSLQQAGASAAGVKEFKSKWGGRVWRLVEIAAAAFLGVIIGKKV